MKKRILFTLLAVILLFTGCYTTVQVRYMVPSEVNMAKYKNLAIMPTTLNISNKSSYGMISFNFAGDPIYNIAPVNIRLGASDIPSDLPEMVSQRLNSVLSRGSYFKVTAPDITKRLLQSRYDLGLTEEELWRRKNIDALVLSTITEAPKSEWIEKNMYQRKDAATGKLIPYYKYYLIQEVEVNYEYKIIDARTMKTVTKGRFESGVISRSTELFVDNLITFTPSTKDLYEKSINSTARYLRNKLVPRYETTNLVLKDNKPESQIVASAIKYAENGDYNTSLELFKKAWTSENHVNSGLNAVMMYEAIGKFELAKKQALEVYDVSGNAEAYSMAVRLEKVIINQNAAKNQL